MKSATHLTPQARRDAVALRDIIVASHAVDVAIKSQRVEGLTAAKSNLRAIVRSANDRGMSWQTIGDALGIRRGAAYQRFRRRSAHTSVSSSLPASVNVAISDNRSAPAN